MKLKLAISALVLLGACEESAFRGHSLPQCGHENNEGGFSGSTELPATDEGNGWVGLMRTSWNDTGLGSQHFKLLQCKTGVVIQGAYSWDTFAAITSMDVPRKEDSLTFFVENYDFDWDQGIVENALKFLDDLKTANFDLVFVRQEYANERNSGSIDRESCACDLYFPSVQRNWPDRPHDQVDYEQRFEEIIARIGRDE